MVIHHIDDRPQYVDIYSCQILVSTDQVGPVMYQRHLIVAFITQGFYCYRIAVLTQSKCAVALISVVGRD